MYKTQKTYNLAGIMLWSEGGRDSLSAARHRGSDAGLQSISNSELAL
jgi:hypothetical protein